LTSLRRKSGNHHAPDFCGAIWLLYDSSAQILCDAAKMIGSQALQSGGCAR